MEAIQKQLDDIALQTRTLEKGDGVKVLNRMRDIAISLEDGQESAPRLLDGPFELMMIRIGVDLKIFNLLSEATKPLTVREISQANGAGVQLLGRLLRAMASRRLIKEDGKDTFSANNVTPTFANPGIQGAVRFYFDFRGPAVQLFPSFLKERGYKDESVLNVLDSPIPHSLGEPEKTTFEHLVSKPDLFADFQAFMTVQRYGMPTWLNVYPYAELAKNLGSDQAFFVDVAGGIGHQSVALRTALPDLTNKIILQDLPQTLQHAIKNPGVEVMAQNFFEPQAIKGARAYYLRNIIHDWPDEKAVEILTNLKNVMAPDSVILIDEMSLPSEDVAWEATTLDINMMVCLSALERTEDNWSTLLAKAGLKLRRKYRYTERLNDCIQECVPVERVD